MVRKPVAFDETRFLESARSPIPAQFLWAFGEKKERKEWAKDERCKVNRKTFYSRIERGWACETALTAVPEPQPRPPSEMLSAFGERRERLEWARDYRCVVRPKHFAVRLRMGWPCEAAMCLTTEQAIEKYIVWGERKSLTGWLADPRCAVTASVLLDRLQQGKPMEIALTQPVPDMVPEVWTAGTLSHKKYKRTYSNIVKHRAFGESRPLSLWASDPRCKVPYGLLQMRVRKGIPVEAAMIFGSNEQGLVRKQFWAFGERKLLFDWTRDSRLAVSPSVLKERLEHGEAMETAMTRKESNSGARSLSKQQRNRKMLTLYGKTATWWVWLKDPRCEVSGSTLKSRLAADWPHTPQILKLAAQLPRNEAEKRFLEQYEAYTDGDRLIGRFRSVKLAAEAILARADHGFVVGAMQNKTWAVPLPERRPSIFAGVGRKRVEIPKPTTPAEVGRFYTKSEVAAFIGTAKIDLLPSFDGQVVAMCFDGRTNPEGPDRIIVAPSQLIETKALAAARDRIEIPVFRKRRDHSLEAKPRGWEYVGNFKVQEFDRSAMARESALNAVKMADAANPRRGHSSDYKVWADKNVQMLKLADQGLNYAQIADQLGIPKTSVFRYIKNALLERSRAGPHQAPRPEPAAQIAKSAAPRDIAGVLILERV